MKTNGGYIMKIKMLFFIIFLLFFGRNIFAFDLAISFHFVTHGKNYTHSFEGIENPSTFDIGLLKSYFYDRDSKFGLDILGLSWSFIYNQDEFSYISLFNLDVNYSLFSLYNMHYLQVYVGGGPGGKKYTINSEKSKGNNFMYDEPLFNASLGLRYRIIEYETFFRPNFDIYAEYNFIKNEIKVGFNTRLATPIIFWLREKSN